MYVTAFLRGESRIEEMKWWNTFEMYDKKEEWVRYKFLKNLTVNKLSLFLYSDSHWNMNGGSVLESEILGHGEESGSFDLWYGW